MYSNQANLGQVHLPEVWANYTTGDSSQVIAILDTGVDYNHPDLAANTWVNHAELNGIEGYDDDGNGYVDDVHGWDFINADNAPLDDNLHGTHVAGIAAAVTDNEIGIAGACWNAQIMPIKVFQSTGLATHLPLPKESCYAANNGATVLNLSFGSYAESSLMLSALENAYATSAIVASAGNNIGPCPWSAPSLSIRLLLCSGCGRLSQGSASWIHQLGPRRPCVFAVCEPPELRGDHAWYGHSEHRAQWRLCPVTGTSMSAPRCRRVWHCTRNLNRRIAKS